MPLRATYRLQLEPGFDFDRAAGIVPYLAALGVSHVYCSPIFEAVHGSRHGYDVVDPTRVRGELGGEEGRLRFVEALRRHGLGLVVDIVPNHVALEGNAWWIDVLTHGTASGCFRFFDVDLAHDPYSGPASPKLLIPILANPYGDELVGGGLRLVVEDGGPGVPQEAVGSLFERFRRGPTRSAGSRRGLGLGLSVVRGLVDAMSGQVSADRSPLGGLAVTVRLRPAPAPAEADR